MCQAKACLGYKDLWLKINHVTDFLYAVLSQGICSRQKFRAGSNNNNARGFHRRDDNPFWISGSVDDPQSRSTGQAIVRANLYVGGPEGVIGQSHRPGPEMTLCRDLWSFMSPDFKFCCQEHILNSFGNDWHF